MAELPSLIDPFGIWRGVAEKLEEGAKDMATKSVNSDEFNSGMHRLMNLSLASRQANQALAQKYFEMLNIPTRVDVDAIGERLQSIEDRLAVITEMLEHLVGDDVPRSGQLPSPPRTRKPPEDAAPASAPAKNAKPRS